MADDPFDRPATPWDIFNKNLGRVDTDIATERIAFCNACPELRSKTRQCKQCNCFMDIKVKLPNAYCPLHKWEAVRVTFKEEG